MALRVYGIAFPMGLLIGYSEGCLYPRALLGGSLFHRYHTN